MEFDIIGGSASQETRRAHSYLVAALLVSLAAILVYVRSLIFFNTPPFVFDLAHLVSVVVLVLFLFRSSKHQHIQSIILVLLWVLTMRLMIPLRFPEGIITNYPDMIYELQIMRKIATTGVISLTAPTRYAQGYAFTPTLETLLVFVSLILGTPLETTLKYAGPFFGVLTIMFLYGFLKAFLPKREAVLTAFIAGSCFHFLRFDALTVHQPLALAFLSLLIYSLTKSAGAWRVLTVLSTFAVVSTHEFTAIVGSFLFLFAALVIMILTSFSGMKRGPFEKRVLAMSGLITTMTLAWLVLIALPSLRGTIGLLGIVLTTLTSSASPISFPLTVTQSSLPLWIRIIGDAGVILFAATCILGFFLAGNKGARSQYKQLLPYATGSAVIFFLGVLSYLRLREATDLLSRSFIYVYLFAAPLALCAIFKISTVASKRYVFRKVICITLITLIVVADVYYNYPRFLYDNSTSMNTEDPRFPLFQWKSAGFFAKNYIEGSTLWGDKIAFNYVGGYGLKNVNLLDRSLNVTLAEWLSTYPTRGDLVILRQSMGSVPYFDFQTSPEGLHHIIVTHNTIYSSGEVIIVVQS